MSEKSHLHRNVSKNWYAAGIIIAILLCVSVFLLISYIKQLSPPDITDCTSIKIQYYPSFMSYYFLMSSYFIRNFVSFMSQEEEKYLHSFDTYSVNDKQKIQAFAKEVSSGSYLKKLWLGQKILMPSHYAIVQCYKDNTLMISFVVFGHTIYIPDNGVMYDYPIFSPDTEILKPTDMLPFELRLTCAKHILKLQPYYAFYWIGNNSISYNDPTYRELYSVDHNSKLYVDPNNWCDIVKQNLQNLYYGHDGVEIRNYSDEQIYDFFSCPGIQKNNLSNKISEENDKPILTFISNYAMNSNCRPDSPKDMVLLFETKDGWNQHGGPELFTFDNHDPKGGCVLFNDGAIKFIRTEEELNKLRWK